MVRTFGVGLVAVLALAVARPAAAEEPRAESVEASASAGEVEALAAQARTMYEQGRYQDAIGAYLKAFQVSPAGALLYNIAFIYDKKLGETELAMDFYRRAIMSPDTDPDLVQRATGRLSELKEAARKPAARQPSAAEAPLDRVSSGAPAGSDPPGARPVGTVADAPDRGRPMTTWGWVALGTGAGLLGGGIVLGVLASSDEESFASSRSLGEKQDLQDGGKAKAIAGDVLMGVGAAAVVTGIVLLVIGDDAPAHDTALGGLKLDVAPWAGEGSGALLRIGGSL